MCWLGSVTPPLSALIAGSSQLLILPRKILAMVSGARRSELMGSCPLGVSATLYMMAVAPAASGVYSKPRGTLTGDPGRSSENSASVPAKSAVFWL